MRKHKKLLDETRNIVMKGLREKAIENIELRRRPGTPPWPISQDMIDAEIKRMLKDITDA